MRPRGNAAGSTRLHRFDRWLYRGGRPNRLARLLLRHGRREVVRLEEVAPGARAPILRRYLDCAPGARAHVPVDRHAPLEDFDRIAAQIPVFRVTHVPAAPG